MPNPTLFIFLIATSVTILGYFTNLPHNRIGITYRVGLPPYECIAV
jgi:hypothetical protein